MKSRIFEESSETVRTSAGRWVRILPDQGEGYRLHDLVHGTELGRVLVDGQDQWIYDGRYLDLDEQEEVAGQITGHRQEMDKLLRSLDL